MKKNKTILILSLGITLMTFSFRTIKDSDTKILNNAKKDTTYYRAYISVEHGLCAKRYKQVHQNSVQMFTI